MKFLSSDDNLRRWTGVVVGGGGGGGKCLILGDERLGTRRLGPRPQVPSFLYNTPSTLSGTSRRRYIAPNASYIISLELGAAPQTLLHSLRCAFQILLAPQTTTRSSQYPAHEISMPSSFTSK